jgi:integration host factor subunit beta
MRAQCNRAELAREVARTCEVTLREAEQMVEAMLDAMVRALKNGERVEIRGFGTLATRDRKARVGRDPRNGAFVQVPAKRLPYFRASRELAALVNGAAAKPE